VTIVLLVGHAHTEWTGRRLAGRMAGVALSDEGRRAAAGLAERVAALPLSVVYTSPLERATATAQAMIGRRAVPVVTSDEFHEMDYGEWTGRPLAELEADPRWREFTDHRAGAGAPGGETSAHLRDRMVAALERLAREHPRSLVAVVTHAEPIRAAAMYCLGAPIERGDRLVIGPASITAVALGDGGPRVVCVNDGGDVAAVLGALP
jgi:probable phosphoglycerate mutase